MRVLVLSNRVPFVHGGAEELSANLVRQLRIAGHEAEEVRIPFAWTPYERLYDEMLLARHLRLANVDRVIALKFPAYLVDHHCKVVWLLHQYRQAYDLYEAGASNIPDDQSGKALRASIRLADSEALGNAHLLFALPEAQRRLLKYNGLRCEAMATPLNDPELFTGSVDDGGYIFAGGRISPGKRQKLLVQALSFAPSTRLVMAGPVETPEFADDLRRLAFDLGVEDRVSFFFKFHSRSEIATFVNHSIASAYVPFEEDNYGYVTLEAFCSSKPVLTSNDSGAVLDVVRHEETGFVAEPTPEAVGQAMERFSTNRVRTWQMGLAAKELLMRLNLNWSDVLSRLLA